MFTKTSRVVMHYKTNEKDETQRVSASCFTSQRLDKNRV